MEVVMENSRISICNGSLLRKSFLTLMAAAAISMSPVQDGFAAEAPAGPGKVYPPGDSDLALRHRALVVLFVLNSLGARSCKDINRECLEFHLQQVCMPDGTIYRNPQGQSLFLSFNVEDLSAALGQPIQLPVDADQALGQASTEGQAGLVVCFIAAGANVEAVDRNGYIPLRLAALRGNEQACVLLLAVGANASAVGRDGSTPLHSAAMRGYEQVCVLLLVARADVNAVNRFGLTPLHGAALKGHASVCVLLLAAEADIDVADQHGRTPLHWAAMNGHEQVCSLLIEAGADIDFKCQLNRTPLYWAALNGQEQVCVLLLAAGVDVGAADQNGETPAMVASNCGYTELAERLDNATNARDVVEKIVSDMVKAVNSVVPESVD
jgi:ankyrin repeat protein